MKYIAVVLLFSLSVASLYSMELELVPFLNKKDQLLLSKKRDTVIEKLFLARRIPALAKSKAVQNKILEYMIKVDREKIEQEIVLHYQQKIALLQDIIHELTVKKYECPDIKINFNTCIETLRGASAGGCCGAMSGAAVACATGMIEAYMWCCCNVPHTKLMWDILVWGAPVSTLSGCLVGSCCVVTGLYDKIKLV